MAEEKTCQSKRRKFQFLLKKIEDMLLDYYGLDSDESIVDFLIEKQDLEQVLNLDKPQNKEYPVKKAPRGAVFLHENSVDEAQEEFFLAVYFERDLRDKVLSDDPFHCLKKKNIDSLCVLVEELSHFHLILQRVKKKRQVSKVELEWQGEIDKFLLTALLLKEQYDHFHLHALNALMYGNPELLSEDQSYRDANKYAARFWQDVLLKNSGGIAPINKLCFRAFMQDNYHKTLSEKLSYFSNSFIFI